MALDDDIAKFEEIAAWAKAEGSRVGYFAALYLGITRAISRNLRSISPDPDRPNFEDPDRMEQFVGIFANRYFTAWEGYRLNRDPATTLTDKDRSTEPWRVHFDHCDSQRSTIMQILGSGANAHMNFDLALSAIELGGPDADDFQALKHDFDTINLILERQIADGHQKVRDLSPLIRILDRFPRMADRIAGELIWKTRETAWNNARKLRGEIFDGRLGSIRDPENIRGLERDTAAFGRRIVRPPLPLHLILAYVLARFEPDGPDGVATVIDRFLDVEVDDTFIVSTISRPTEQA